MRPCQSAHGLIRNHQITAKSRQRHFLFQGFVRFDLGLPMLAANVLGGYLGTRTAIARGSGFIKGIYLAMAAMTARPILASLTYSPSATGTAMSSVPLSPSPMRIGQPTVSGENPFSQAHSRCSRAFLRLPGYMTWCCSPSGRACRPAP